MAATPSLTVVYGPSGRGKSLDALYSAPTGDFLIPVKGNLSPWVRYTGVAPNAFLVNTLDEARRHIQQTKARFVVIDDTTVLADRSRLAFEARGLGGFDLWGAVWKAIHMLREISVSRGIDLYLNFHDSAPFRDDDGNTVPGGPKLPSKNLTALIPHVAQLVVRAEISSFVVPPEWGGVYNCDPGQMNQWILKDRWGVVGKSAPMNLREIIHRAAEVGHDVNVPPRAPGLEWLDGAAAGLANGLASGALPDVGAARAAVMEHYAGKDPRHLLWAWRDGVARHRLRAADNAFLASFGSPGAGVTVGGR